MTEKNSMKSYYEHHINSQKLGYEITAKLIGYVIRRMQDEGLISGDVQITGRIKSFKSAFENSNKKKIDDCFGIRIAGPEEDLEKIRNQLKKILVIKQTKDHRKKTNTPYNGIHQMAHIQKSQVAHTNIDYELFPLIEIQYWNREIERQCIDGELSYANYKHGDYIKIKQRFEEEEQSVSEQLPIYYEIKGNKIVELSPKETLYKLYPEIKAIESMQSLRKITQTPEDNEQER